MTLPKGYKNPSSNFRPERNRGKPNNVRRTIAVITFIFFIIGLIVTIYNITAYLETGSEIEKQKKVVDQAKREYLAELKYGVSSSY